VAWRGRRAGWRLAPCFALLPARSVWAERVAGAGWVAAEAAAAVDSTIAKAMITERNRFVSAIPQTSAALD
jgi:hypothetical protein